MGRHIGERRWAKKKDAAKTACWESEQQGLYIPQEELTSEAAAYRDRVLRGPTSMFLKWALTPGHTDLSFPAWPELPHHRFFPTTISGLASSI